MTRGVRRALLFLAMVAAGLLVVYVLADPFKRRRPVELEKQNAPEGGLLKVKDAEQRETQMVFGDVSFDVLPEGAGSNDKPLYRVHIQSGHPDATGTFLATKPVITLLDKVTGAETGQLSGDTARFQVGSSVGGTVTIELGRMRVDNSELSGNVRGRFTSPDGSVAELAAESLAIRDSLVEAPGLVTWSRADLSVSGYDMTWDGAIGKLIFNRGARLVLPALDVRPGYDLLAPGGLTLVIPPEAEDPRAAAHAELRGRVTGSSTDGRTLEADLLVLDGPAGTVTLTGDAGFAGAGPGGERARLTARQIVLTADGAGALSSAQAVGDVHLVSRPDAGGAANAPLDAPGSIWLATEHLDLEGTQATSPDRVTWGRDTLSGVGTELRWDLERGRLELARDAELSVAPQANDPLAGLHVVAPGGLVWTLPAAGTGGGATGGGAAGVIGAGHGELRGPVHGSLPDGSNFDADRLVYAGPLEGLRLEGRATVQREAPDVRSRLSAGLITVVGEGSGRTLLGAEGSVEFNSGPADAPASVPRARLLAQHLKAREGRLHCDGPVHWTRGGLDVQGNDLDWNEPEGRIELASDAHLRFADTVRGIDVEAHAQGGLLWVAPPGSSDPLAEGRGELRGGVTGRSAEGDTLEADRVLIDGPAGTLELLGRASVAVAAVDLGTRTRPPLRVKSEQLLVAEIDRTPRVECDGLVHWEVGDLGGQATGLRWESGTGHLNLARDVALRLVSAPGQPSEAVWTVTAEGALDWQAPADSAAPVAEGRIELKSDVIGRNDRGQTFRTMHLIVEGESDQVTLLGPSTFENNGPAGGLRLLAQRSIEVHSSPDGSGDRLIAEGEVVTTLVARDGGPPLELTGERLSFEGSQRSLRLEGQVSAARGSGVERLKLTASDHLLVRTNERNEPVWFEADRDVHLSRDFEARGDTLWWDVTADQAQLRGACRMELAGAVMSFERAEFSPRARSFKILRSTVSTDG